MTDTVTRRLPSLTGMRFVAAALVFVSHATMETKFIGGSEGRLLDFVFSKAGTVGVGFFYILSGFVLTWSARPGESTGRFWRRRLVKIYPNHLATFLLMAGLLVMAGQSITVKQALPNLFLIQTWFPGRIDVAISMNGVSWSLACEAFFYLSFPLFLLLLDKVRVERLWLGVGVVAAMIMAIPVMTQLLISNEPRLPVGPASATQVWFIYFFPPVRALEFVLGMFLAKIVLTGQWVRLGLGSALAIAGGAYALTLLAPYLISVSGASSLGIAPLIAAAAVADWRGLGSPFRGEVMVWLGDVSFAFYMIHRMVIVYGHQILGPGRTWPTLQGAVYILLLFGIAVLLGWLLYTCVERPIVRRWSSPVHHVSGSSQMP